MSDFGDELKSALDRMEVKAEGLVDKVKMKVLKNPWPFLVGTLVLGFVVGLVVP